MFHTNEANLIFMWEIEHDDECGITKYHSYLPLETNTILSCSCIHYRIIVQNGLHSIVPINTIFISI